jgi:DNA-binding NarL/FixJ family response regulator
MLDYPRCGARRLPEFVPRVELTERETEVLERMVKVLRNRDIAELISRAEEIVKVHVQNILEKLGGMARTTRFELATSAVTA